MDNERDDWAQDSETALIFDQWMRAIVSALRAERGATINQFWLLLLISEHPERRGDSRRDARAQLHHGGRLRRSARAGGSPREANLRR